MTKSPLWVSRQARFLVVAGCLLTSSPALAADPSKDLIGAFAATYQQVPPLIRTIREPITEADHPEHVVETLTLTAALAAARLVKRQGSQYALLISETAQDVGHAEGGAFSISYLTYDKGWTLERVWPEMTFMGEGGIPADRTWDAKFGAEPLILASTTWCGMGICSEGIAAFALGQTAPRFLGLVAGGLKTGLSPNLINTCPTYHYTAEVGAPSSKKGVFSIRYTGWTASSGKTRPKHWFRLRVDYAVSTGGLIASPAIQIPGWECR